MLRVASILTLILTLYTGCATFFPTSSEVVTASAVIDTLKAQLGAPRAVLVRSALLHGAY